jgi:ferredoxin
VAGAAEAARIARRDLVFPETLAAVCPAFCEGPCVRKQFDRSIEIRRLHGFAAQASTALPVCAPPTGKRVAIVGADPVGLAAAWFLQLAGHACTVYGSVSLAPTFVVPALAGNPSSSPSSPHGTARAVDGTTAKSFPAKAGTTNADAVAGPSSAPESFAREVGIIQRLGVRIVAGLPTPDSAEAFVLTHDADGPGVSASSPHIFRAEHRLTDPAALVRAVAAARAMANQVIAYFSLSASDARPATQALGAPQASGVAQASAVAQASVVAQAFQPVLAGRTSQPASIPSQMPSSAEPRQAGKPVPQPRPLYFAARAETDDERRVILAASHVQPLAEGETVLPPETRRGAPLDDAAPAACAAGVPNAASPDSKDGARGPQPRASSLQPPACIAREADRCLRCGCAKRDTCRLRHYGAVFGARPHRFQGARRELAPDATHAEIVYEPGKCILCGLCLKIAEAAGEAPGLAFVGRGFPTRVAVPFGDDLAFALKKSARACAEACPTAALSLRKT